MRGFGVLGLIYQDGIERRFAGENAGLEGAGGCARPAGGSDGGAVTLSRGAGQGASKGLARRGRRWARLRGAPGEWLRVVLADFYDGTLLLHV